VGSAHANNLPFAEPVEFVRICDVYGNGFFYIPGTDTCLRISGLVRVDTKFEDDSFNSARNDVQTDVRGRIQLDARTETDWGTLRSYIELERRSDSYIGKNPDGAGETIVRQMYVEFAGITAGHLYRSLYDFAPYKHMSDLFSDERVNTLAYTAIVSDGFSITAGIEDNFYRAMPNDGTIVPGVGIADSSLDQVWPNGIGIFDLKKDWGEARLAAAIQDNEGDRDVGPEGDKIGWASLASLVVNLPGRFAGNRAWAQGGYSEGATSYIGGEDFRVNFVSSGLSASAVRDQRDDGFGNLINTKAWSAGAGIKWFWSEVVHSNISAIYADINPAGAFAAFDYLFTEANIFWNPLPNLELGLGVHRGEATINSPGADAPDTEDHWAVVSRIGRSF
jgi:hypothetical protein